MSDITDAVSADIHRIDIVRVSNGFVITRLHERPGMPALQLDMAVAENVKSALPVLERMMKRIL